MKNKSVIIIAVTALVVIAIGFFLIWPTVSSLWTGWRNLSSSEAEMQKAQEKTAAINALRKNKVELTNVAAVAENYIPKSYESSQLVLELAAIATDNSLTVQSTSIDKSTAPPKAKDQDEAATAPSAAPSASASAATSSSGLQNINFSIKLSGTFPNFLNFLKTVETSSKLTVIKSIALQMDSTGGNLSAQIAGSSFYKPSVTLESTTENLKVSAETIKMFLNLKSFAEPINPADSGYGRGDPFAGY